MKTERLLSIVIYLLNHDTVSAAKLAERFAVSRRTILRDMEQLSLARIPIQSHPGARGGYAIMKGYKIDAQLMNADDQASILTALQGFLTAYDHTRYQGTLEKLASLLPKQPNQHVFLDLGASGENAAIQAKLKALESAIADKKVVQMTYVNAWGGETHRLVEPIALNYRWYSWYLLAYCQTKQDYRVFKLVRISDHETTPIAFTKEHGDPAPLLAAAFEDHGRKALAITLLCRASIRVQVCEYLKGTIINTLENGDFIMQLEVLEEERMWFAVLLSFGDQIVVLEPRALKNRIIETAENILTRYKEH
ncbi:MAG: YafY family transcriptional regulator [Oscillospiraceae bacterium]|jgi:predicted DNA-binding transcriptional regulator YafY|nr:YafY family transcriptional regulator [Oscillospiraceae bacterium]